LSELRHLERVIQQVCRRSGLRKEEVEDFASHVHVKLIEDDYSVLRRFKGTSSFTTYINTVVLNLLRDYLNHQWGKWRPCAAAQRLGAVAIQLDRLLNRDHYTFDEACQFLRTNYHAQESVEQLQSMAAQFPFRTSHRTEDAKVPEELPDPSESADRRVREAEREARRRKLFQLLEEALATLDPEDALIVKMRAQFSIVEIARVLGLDQKPLYRRIERILKTLRKELERRGVHPDDISDLLDE
jgi:RNA polymerase sigma factor for flagellar operon FliA